MTPSGHRDFQNVFCKSDDVGHRFCSGIDAPLVSGANKGWAEVSATARNRPAWMSGATTGG